MKILHCTLPVLTMLVIFAVISTTTAETAWLPGFEATDLDGGTLNSEAFRQQGPWLLVYVKSGCRPCELFLELFQGEDFDRPQKIVILVGASPVKAKAMAQKYPELRDASWYVDSKGEGFSRLKLAGAPVALGLHGDEIAWRLQGLVPNSKDVRSIVLSWLEE